MEGYRYIFNGTVTLISKHQAFPGEFAQLTVSAFDNFRTTSAQTRSIMGMRQDGRPWEIGMPHVSSNIGSIPDMATAMKREKDESVHKLVIAGHGNSGTLWFDGATIENLNTTNLLRYAADVSAIKTKLAKDAVVILHGCSIAQNELGLVFLQLVANLFGCEVRSPTVGFDVGWAPPEASWATVKPNGVSAKQLFDKLYPAGSDVRKLEIKHLGPEATARLGIAE